MKPSTDVPSLACMGFTWDDSRRAFADAAAWFVDTAALVGDRWHRPGLGEWDVRALVGHTNRSFLTVETYLARLPAAVAGTSSGRSSAIARSAVWTASSNVRVGR